jgi:hypothetical protein
MFFNDDENGVANAVIFDSITLLSPREDDDDVEGDWNDEEDEDFDDRVEDTNDLHEIMTDNNLLDPDDEDHLPDNDF